MSATSGSANCERSLNDIMLCSHGLLKVKPHLRTLLGDIRPFVGPGGRGCSPKEGFLNGV